MVNVLIKIELANKPKASLSFPNKLLPGAGSAIVKENRLASYIYPVYKLPLNTTLVVRKKAVNPDEPNSGVITQFQVTSSSYDLHVVVLAASTFYNVLIIICEQRCLPARMQDV